MKALKIDHLGIAVPDLEAALRAYRALGFEVELVHEVPTEKVRVAFLPVGESRLELLEPTDPGSVIARFLERPLSALVRSTVSILRAAFSISWETTGEGSCGAGARQP